MRRLDRLHLGAAFAVLVTSLLLVGCVGEAPSDSVPSAASESAAGGVDAARQAAAVTARGGSEEPLFAQLRAGEVEYARIREVAADREPWARGQTVRLAVEVEMLPGMHVNANPPSFDWMIPIQVSVRGADGVRVVESFYPEAKSVKFPYDDEPYLVYDGTFLLGLVLAVAADIPPGGRELEVVLDYQACNDEACFAPTDTSAKLPIMVVADAAESHQVASPLIDRAPFPRD